MRRRIEVLRRLAALYEVVEKVRSAELQRTISALRGAEEAISVHCGVLRSARIASRAALVGGDRMGSILAETDTEIVAGRGERLQEIRIERRALQVAAEEQYLASRRESDQMTRLREDLSARQAIVEGRRVQAMADDRFLAQKRWMEMRMREDESPLM